MYVYMHVIINMHVIIITHWLNLEVFLGDSRVPRKRSSVILEIWIVHLYAWLIQQCPIPQCTPLQQIFTDGIHVHTKVYCT